MTERINYHCFDRQAWFLVQSYIDDTKDIVRTFDATFSKYDLAGSHVQTGNFFLEKVSASSEREEVKVEMKDQGCQYDPLLDDNRPIAWKADRDQIRELEQEVREARNVITNGKMSHEAHARKLLGEARDAQQRYETLKASVEAQGSSTDTSHLEIPEFMYATNGGQSFHGQGCPSLACHFQPRHRGNWLSAEGASNSQKPAKSGSE